MERQVSLLLAGLSSPARSLSIYSSHDCIVSPQQHTEMVLSSVRPAGCWAGIVTLLSPFQQQGDGISLLADISHRSRKHLQSPEFYGGVSVVPVQQLDLGELGDFGREKGLAR